MTQKTFRETLVEQLSAIGSPSTSTNRPQTPITADATHMPFYFTEGQDVPQGQAATAGRRLCKMCHKKTPIGCEGCGNVPLCFNSARNCFRQWHQDKGL